LGKKEWLLGAISLPDFQLAEFLLYTDYFSKGELQKKYPNLGKFLNRFKAITSLKSFIEKNEPNRLFFPGCPYSN